MAMVEAGKKAPDFVLPSSGGGDVSLKGLKGKTVVLYFYPKDDTPGCTGEACAFRDSQVALKRRGVVVLGVSGDSLASHAKFKKKYKLNFPLLSDLDKAVAKKYGAWGEKVLYGKKTIGMIRSTFVRATRATRCLACGGPPPNPMSRTSAKRPRATTA